MLRPVALANTHAVHQANDHVIYIKHPKTKPYVVCAVRGDYKAFSPNFCFTLALESEEAVADGYRWLAKSGKELGVTELCELQSNGPLCSFLFKDLDQNWWEISSPN